MNKICKECNIEKEIKTGLVCNKCINKKRKEYLKSYYVSNKDKIKEYGKNYYADNKDKQLEYGKNYYVNNIDKIKEYNKNVIEQNKTCKVCNIEKNIKKGLICNKCINKKRKEYLKNYYADNKDKQLEYGKNYYADNKDKQLEYNKKYRIENKDKIKEYNKSIIEKTKIYQAEYNKKYQIENKDNLHLYRKSYYDDNKEKRLEYQREWCSYKYKNDSLYKIQCLVRANIGKSIRKNGYTKKSRTHEILGCSFDELKIYLESLFESWMTWDNHGSYNGNYEYGWDIDHIIPLSSATTEEELIKLCHYTNLQPLDSKINRYEKRDFI